MFVAPLESCLWKQTHYLLPYLGVSVFSVDTIFNPHEDHGEESVIWWHKWLVQDLAQSRYLVNINYYFAIIMIVTNIAPGLPLASSHLSLSSLLHSCVSFWVFLNAFSKKAISYPLELCTCCLLCQPSCSPPALCRPDPFSSLQVSVCLPPPQWALPPCTPLFLS